MIGPSWMTYFRDQIATWEIVFSMTSQTLCSTLHTVGIEHTKTNYFSMYCFYDVGSIWLVRKTISKDHGTEERRGEFAFCVKHLLLKVYPKQSYYKKPLGHCVRSLQY